MTLFNNRRLQFVSIFLLILFLFAAISAEAQDSKIPKYLPEGKVDGAALIGPPPAVGSPEFQTQMTIVMWLQTTRTPEQVAFVKTALNLNRFAPIIGDELFDVDGVVLRQTMAEIIKEVKNDYDPLKTNYDIPRPFVANENIKPSMAEVNTVGSYPSGHATRAVVYARILGEVFPDKKDELMDLALQIGYGRAIAGVHYPMDVISGQKLGNAYADVIIEGPTFKEALIKIKGE